MLRISYEEIKYNLWNKYLTNASSSVAKGLKQICWSALELNREILPETVPEVSHAGISFYVIGDNG